MKYEIKRPLEECKGAKIMRQRSINKYLDNPNKCKCCNKIIQIPLGVKVCDVSKKTFCSISCSSKCKRKQSNGFTCKYCNKRCTTSSRTCIKCRREKEEFKSLNITFRELVDKYNLKGANTHIRHQARKLLQRHTEEKCKHCGFDHFADACHIKPVSNFPSTALISEINALDNLIWLCPNHHRMLDRGLLNIEVIKNK